MIIIVLTPREKETLAVKQATGLPLVARERSYLAQAEQAAKEQGKRIAGISKADNAAIIDKATPEHLRRPRNIPAETLANYESSNQFKDERLRRRMDELRKLAAAREVEITAEMEIKQKAFEVANDPAVKAVLDHCDLAAKSAAPEDQQAWSELRGLVIGGGSAITPDYWRKAAELTNRQKESAGAVIDSTREALDEQFKKYTDAQIAFATAQGQAEIALEEAQRVLGEDQ